MKIKTLIYIFTFIAMPFVNADVNLGEILTDRQEFYQLQGDEDFGQILALASSAQKEELYEKLMGFIGKNNFWEDELFQRALEMANPSASEAVSNTEEQGTNPNGNGALSEEEAVQIAMALSTESSKVDASDKSENGDSSVKLSLTAEQQPTNPYLGKTPDELLALSDADPSLNDNPLFNEALSRALGGEDSQPITSDIGSLSETFPLSCVLQKACNFDELKSSLEVLSLDYSTKDQYSIPVLNDFLQKNGLTAITTPGFGNCAFDAALLSWFCRNNLYDPQWNTTLGAYLESQIEWFRGEIAKLLPEKEMLGDETQGNIKTKGIYVTEAAFDLIAKYLKTEIILIAPKTTLFFSPEEERHVEVIAREEIKAHPNALIVCYNGEDHFLATRPLLPEESQK